MKHYFSDVKAMEQEIDFRRPSLIVIDTAICEYYFKKAADFCKFKKKKKTSTCQLCRWDLKNKENAFGMSGSQ